MNREFAALLDECGRGGIEVRADSRQVGSGDIFVAVPGVKEDGARFIPAAVEAGAGVIVCAARSEEAAAAVSAGRRVIYHADPREAL